MKYVKSLMGKNKLLFQKTLNNLINTLRRADILIFFCHCLEYETKEHINNLLIIYTKKLQFFAILFSVKPHKLKYLYCRQKQQKETKKKVQPQ